MSYYRKDSKLFHVCENCPTGKQISKDDRREGVPMGGTRCAECDNLVLTNKCEKGGD
jgi:ssDNA-binding Zn-finger/Zn-ribbon topoisomerase 1